MKRELKIRLSRAEVAKAKAMAENRPLVIGRQLEEAHQLTIAVRDKALLQVRSSLEAEVTVHAMKMKSNGSIIADVILE